MSLNQLSQNRGQVQVFISYSHSDRVFVSQLASQLVKHRATVWIDESELHIGDSLIQRIQEAIKGASALLVVLSKAFVQSEWCKKEMSTGLVRELDEKRVVVLPVLIEDCDIFHCFSGTSSTLTSEPISTPGLELF